MPIQHIQVADHSEYKICVNLHSLKITCKHIPVSINIFMGIPNSITILLTASLDN